MDIENRKYKIGSVNLTFNNDRIGSKRLSNKLYTDSHFKINNRVEVYFKTNSMDLITDLYSVYIGKIREMKNTNKVITIVLEDSSQEDLHSEVPKARTSTSDNLLEKYRNKVIPMVYGDVKKSPGVLEIFQDNFLVTQSKIIFDDKDLNIDDDYINDNTELAGNTIIKNTKIYIGNNGSYIPIGQAEIHNPTENDLNRTFEPLNNSKEILFRIGTDDNPGILGLEFIYSHIKRVPDSVFSKIYRPDVEDSYETPASLGYFYSFNGSNTINDSDIIDDEYNLGLGKLIQGGTSPVGLLDNSNYSFRMSTGSYMVLELNYKDIPFDFIANTYLLFQTTIQVENSIISEYNDEGEPGKAIISLKEVLHRTDLINADNTIDSTLGSSDPTKLLFYKIIEGSGNITEYNNITDNSNDDILEFPVNISDLSVKNLYFGLNRQSSDVQENYTVVDNWGDDLDIYFTPIRALTINSNIFLYQKVNINNAYEQSYFTDLKGRSFAYNNDGITTPKGIFTDIIQNELKASEGVVDISLIPGFTDASSGEHGTVLGATTINWKYAFSQDKEINSKKLIEEFASYTQLFPYFKDGVFNVENIKKSYDPDTEITDSKYIINPDKIRSYSFSKTKINNVYTDIEFHWDYNFSGKKYNEVYEITAQELFPNYSPSTYGIEQKTLKKECRFIYDQATAYGVANFLLALNCNQHTYIDLDLPLDYIYLKVGNTVKFPQGRLLGGEKVYGEDYTISSYNVEGVGQTKYNLWKIVSVSISNKAIKVTLYQLHNLEGQETIVLGCMDPNANNYDSSANISDNSCTYDETVPVVYGCTDPSAINYNSLANTDNGSCEYALPFAPSPESPTNIMINGNDYSSLENLEIADSITITYTPGLYTERTKIVILSNIPNDDYPPIMLTVWDENNSGEIVIPISNDENYSTGNQGVLYIPPGLTVETPLLYTFYISGEQQQTESVTYGNTTYQVEATTYSDSIENEIGLYLEEEPIANNMLVIEKGTIDIQKIDDGDFPRVRFEVKFYVSGDDQHDFINSFVPDLPPLYVNQHIQEYTPDQKTGIRSYLTLNFQDITGVETNPPTYETRNCHLNINLVMDRDFIESEYTWSSEFQTHLTIYTFHIERVSSTFYQNFSDQISSMTMTAYTDVDNETIIPQSSPGYYLTSGDYIPFHIKDIMTSPKIHSLLNSTNVANICSEFNLGVSNITSSVIQIELRYNSDGQEIDFTDFEIITDSIISDRNSIIYDNSSLLPYLSNDYLSYEIRSLNAVAVDFVINVTEYLAIMPYIEGFLALGESKNSLTMPTPSFLLEQELIAQSPYNAMINTFGEPSTSDSFLYFFLFSNMISSIGVNTSSIEITTNEMIALKEYIFNLVLGG